MANEDERGLSERMQAELAIKLTEAANWVMDDRAAMYDARPDKAPKADAVPAIIAECTAKNVAVAVRRFAGAAFVARAGPGFGVISRTRRSRRSASFTLSSVVKTAATSSSSRTGRSASWKRRSNSARPALLIRPA